MVLPLVRCAPDICTGKASRTAYASRKCLLRSGPELPQTRLAAAALPGTAFARGCDGVCKNRTVLPVIARINARPFCKIS